MVNYFDTQRDYFVLANLLNEKHNKKSEPLLLIKNKYGGFTLLL
jgi:hypothetical protein